MRSGRSPHDEFSRFYTSTYPKLVAQLFALTGDMETAAVAATTTLTRAWRSWPSLRTAPDRLIRTRWNAVVVAAELEPGTDTAPGPRRGAAVSVGDEDAVVVAALQLLPSTQRRALVLHYMGGVAVNDLAILSGSSADHIESVLDDGFTALSASLQWAEHDRRHDDADGDRGTAADRRSAPGADDSDLDDADLRFEWTAEALADAAARLPEEITAPSPAAILRRAALVRWSTQALPFAAVAACVATVAVIAAQPEPLRGADRPGIYAQNGDNDPDSRQAAIDPDPGDGPTATGATVQHRIPAVRMRSVALTALIDPQADAPPLPPEVAPATDTAGAAAPTHAAEAPVLVPSTTAQGAGTGASSAIVAAPPVGSPAAAGVVAGGPTAVDGAPVAAIPTGAATGGGDSTGAGPTTSTAPSTSSPMSTPDTSPATTSATPTSTGSSTPTTTAAPTTTDAPATTEQATTDPTVGPDPITTTEHATPSDPPGTEPVTVDPEPTTLVPTVPPSGLVPTSDAVATLPSMTAPGVGTPAAGPTTPAHATPPPVAA